MSDSAKPVLERNVALLRSKASRLAWYGMGIGIAGAIIATVMTSFVQYREITLATLIEVQSGNFAVWVMDIMPFVFAMWGQHVSSLMAHQAGAMVLDQTEDLRTEAAALKLQMRRKAMQDEVTGIANRSVFLDRLEQAVGSAQSTGTRVAVYALDLRRFGEVNDTLGHYHGDRLLKRVATRLLGCVQPPATLARIRGNEFGVLFPDLNGLEDIQKLNKAVHDALDMPFSVEGLSIELQLVAAAAVYPLHADDSDTLMQKLDIALHEAKRKGSDYLLYDPKFDHHSPARLTLMGELRKAIRADQMRLYLQPIVSADNSMLIGCESLVRWQHDKMGLVPPNEFIPLAEQSGAIIELSEWVLGKAMDHAVALRDMGLTGWVSANVSARVIMDPDFIDLLSGLLAGRQLEPERLLLEITEDTLMGEQQRVLAICDEIRQLGVGLAIDDFGTGYSQLSYLTRLPVREIKIDRSFVAEMLNSENDEIVVKAAIDLAHTLGKMVIAEGIETEPQLQALARMGCDAIQGYLIGRPMPIEAFSDWLAERGWAEQA